MKLFNIGLPGQTQTLFVAKDKKDAYERRTEVDHTFDFLPVEIEEVTVEGYDIRLYKDRDEEEQEVVEEEPLVVIEEVEVKKEEPPEQKPKSKSKSKTE